MFIKIIICLLFTSLTVYSKYPYSFRDSLNQLSSIEEVDNVTTDIPNIEAILSYSDSLDEAGITHSEFYGKSFYVNLEMNEIGTWDTKTRNKQTEIGKENEKNNIINSNNGFRRVQRRNSY